MVLYLIYSIYESQKFPSPSPSCLNAFGNTPAPAGYYVCMDGYSITVKTLLFTVHALHRTNKSLFIS
eukprot:scaffold2775_cov91-Skeletonema_marinoi.AAC.3